MKYLILAVTLLSGCAQFQGLVGQVETQTMEAANIAVEASAANLRISIHNVCRMARSGPVQDIFNTEELRKARTTICDSVKTKL